MGSSTVRRKQIINTSAVAPKIPGESAARGRGVLPFSLAAFGKPETAAREASSAKDNYKELQRTVSIVLEAS